jgi:hypothetical protein
VPAEKGRVFSQLFDMIKKTNILLAVESGAIYSDAHSGSVIHGRGL